ncbi:histone-like nucleoid-structuring protein Lsr2 [Corynebacterium sp. TAE3-ERU16]|uniref:histone-like nucleoid-structuring protein Lsr2 n=1 Tax=Corynebacterium sp. TAE3-ERU16 TaxID=2849493 RepID=UPI001C465A78|nr:Lsr2 family protein [Corynebacterium sp. TAE3-ERU16]MBV7294262.1 Lsr2 family protein [Corynebacterium sp. TAE3-ERU16]
MARREITQYFDDLTKTPLSEEELHVVHFSLDGTDYSVDLNEEHANELRESLQRYIEVGRKRTGGSSRQRRRSSGGSRNRTKEIRQWARENGYEVADRGKIPDNIVEAFNAAN